MKKIYLMLLTMLCAIFIQAQTTIISPTGDGGFETGTTFSANGWTESNSINNPWVVGTAFATAPFANRSAYISDAAGATNTYTPANNATNFFWRDVTVPAGETKITLSFNWNQQGESTWDIWQVFTAPTTITPVASATHPGTGTTNIPVAIAGATFVGNGALIAGVQTATYILPASLSGTTFRLIFSWKNETGGTQPPAAIDNISLVSSLPGSITSTAIGGLWSSPATWVGGIVPAGDDVTIANGANVVVDQIVTVKDLTIGGGISGILQWNATANALNASGNLLVNAGANLNMFTAVAAPNGVTINAGGNFTNNGTVHAAYVSANHAYINFNNAASSPTLDGTGNFVGGIVSLIGAQTNGTTTINTSQNLITRSLVHTGGTFNTNGKIAIDNTAQFYGQPINQRVYEIVVTAMGTGFTSTPTVTISAPTGAGVPATATANVDLATGTLRSITITNAGDGYRANPTVTITGGGGTGATAVAVVSILSQGLTTSTFTRSGQAVLSGGLNIKSDQAVGNIYTTSGGIGYTTAPNVGFALPFGFQNLVIAGGSGYTSTPTVTITGGTKLTGSTNPAFTVIVTQGKVVSVIATSGGTLWTSPPTLTLTGGGGTGATCAYPTNALATATASISNGMVSNFTVTNGGFGYTAAPTVGLVNVTTPTTAASTPTSRVGLYNVNLGWFIPATVNVVHDEQGFMPANRRINALTMTAGGANFIGNVELYAAAPLTLTNGLVNMGTNTLLASHPVYVGTTGSATSSVSGNITLSTPGGSLTRTFPYDASLVAVLGTGTNATGSSITSLTASRTAAPSGMASPVGSPTGTRAYRLVTNVGATYGTAPTITLNYNATDALLATNESLFIGQSTALAGPWTVRSVAATAGSLPATGSRITGVIAPTLIVPTGDDYFGWVGPTPCSGAPTPGNTIASASIACIGTTVTLSLQSSALGTPGITYQWFSSTDGTLYSPISGATSATYVATIAGNTYFQAEVTCSAGPVTTTSTPIFVGTIVCAPTYSTTYATGVPYTSIAATGTSATWISLTDGDDNTTTNITLPFTFAFKGNTYTTVNACTNGWLAFGGTTSNSLSGNLSAAITGLTAMIAPFWEDIVVTGNVPANLPTSFKYETQGIAPDRVFIAEWIGMERFLYAGPNLNFQVKLYETSNRVEIVYGTMEGFNGTIDNTYTYGTGLRATSTDYISLQNNNSNYFSTTVANASLKIVPECNSVYTFSPSAVFSTGIAPVATPPVNDEPAAAISIAVNPAPCTSLCGTYYETAGATASTGITACSAATPGTADDDVWFQFIATQTGAKITALPAAGYDMVLQLFSDAGVTPLACVNASAIGLSEIINTTALTVGNTYYIRAYHAGASNGSTAALSICVSEIVPPPVNDNICGATSLAVNATCVNIAATTISATASPTTPAACGTADDDIWYSFVATSTLNLITVQSGAGFNAAVQLLASSDNTCTGTLTQVTCVDATSTAGAEVVNSTLVLGKTYFVRVYNSPAGAGTGNFTICITAPVPACVTNTAPTVSATNVSLTPSLAWASSPLASSYEVYFGTTNPPTTLLTTVTTNSYTIPVASILNQATTYYWYIKPININGANTTCNLTNITSFTTQLCSNPVGVAINTITDISANVTWAGTGNYILEYGPTGYTPGTGANAGGGGTLISPATSPVALTGLTPNTNYQVYVRQDCSVASNGYSPNSSVLAFTTLIIPQCPVIIAPANASSTCASAGTILSWTASVGATSYDVYLDAGAGPATTLISASQVGLTYNTGVLASGQYSWKVNAKNIAGVSVGCTDFTFTILPRPTASITPSGTVSICAPSNQVYTATTDIGNTYQWKLNGANISGETASTYTATASGTYQVVVSVTATGCKDSSTNSILIKNVIPTIPLITPSATTVCGIPKLLTASGSNAPGTILSENFNGVAAGTTISGNLPAGWTGASLTAGVRRWGVVASAQAGSTVGGGNFLYCESDGYSTFQTRSEVITPTFNATGYTSVNIKFKQYYRDLSTTTPSDSAKVYVSNNGGTTWVLQPPADYDVSQGTAFTSAGAINTSITLNAVSLTNDMKVRLVYNSDAGGNDWYWAVDDFVIDGIQNSNYSWAPLTGLFNDAAGTIAYTGTPTATVYANPSSTAIYTVTATSTPGCQNTANVTVNVLPPGISTWTGAINTDWNNVGNWNCGGIPTITSEVVIPAGKPNYPVIMLNVEIKKITVDPATSVTVGSGFELKLNGN